MLLLDMMSLRDGLDAGGIDGDRLMSRIAEGDEEAFLQLYQSTDRTIYSFILSILKNSQDAEEIMQETYMKIWTSASSYQSKGKPLAWIFTIARNLCYMKFREQKYRSDLSLDDLAGNEQGEPCSKIEDAADKVVLKAAVEILKEEEREIVLLHAAAGLKHREIAEALGMPLATVLSKYNRAIKKLGQYLREE